MVARPFPLFLGMLSFIPVLAGCLGPETEEPSAPPLPPEPYTRFLAADGDLTTRLGVDVPVNFLATPVVAPANELTIAVNPRDPLHLVAGAKDYFLGTDFPCPATPSGRPVYPVNVWTAVFWSFDGGKTWGNGLIPGHPADSENATHPNRAWTCNSDPVVVFGDDGTVYYSGLGIRGSNIPDPGHPCLEGSSSIWLMKSTDGGVTWGDFSCVAAGTNTPVLGETGTPQVYAGEDVDKQWFAVDGSNVYFTYMAFRQGPTADAAGEVPGPWDVELLFRRSTDGGATWGPEIPIFQGISPQNPTAFTPDEQYSMPQVGPDGTVYVLFRSFGDDGGVFFARSDDRGATFGPSRRIASISELPGEFFQDGYRISSYPVLASDPESHRLGVVWSDYATGDADVVFMRSSDGGLTWSDPIRLNNDTLDVDNAHQFLPWIVTSPNGDFHVAWLDSRASLNATRLDVYYRASQDGGATWGPELKVNTNTIETEVCHHQSSRNFIGDYLGLTASDYAVHPFWPDGTAGRCEGITATILR